jgi:DNA processing protein
VWPDGFTSGAGERRAALLLSSLAGLRPRTLLPVAAEAGTASACVELVARGALGSEEDRRFVHLLEADAIDAALRACGARTVPWDDPEYPPQLRTIHDPPFVLYVRGGALPAAERAVAVVGSRRCTDLGRDLARALGRGLAAAGVTVVSGAARGIDAASHEGALEGGGSTVAVLGAGIDASYPRGSRALLERIRGQGAVVSEYPPGVPPRAFRFPARNRIVAGLCRAAVVVEGEKDSGSLITGSHALEFGRDVFAVPAALNNPLSQAPLMLIRDGATMIRSAQDLLEDLGLGPGPSGPPPDLTLAELAAFEALTGPTLPDRVARELRIGLADALTLLMRLEMRGLVRSVGGRFEATLAAVPATRPQ